MNRRNFIHGALATLAAAAASRVPALRPAPKMYHTFIIAEDAVLTATIGQYADYPALPEIPADVFAAVQETSAMIEALSGSNTLSYPYLGRLIAVDDMTTYKFVYSVKQRG